MSNIITDYYQGILLKLRSEVDHINSQFHHQGMKGEGNEEALRSLLERFIPGKYGLGCGVVIDHTGAQSRQCDVVIYDKMHYPSLLSLSSAQMFPVDIVYATVEVKTTLTAQSVKEALTNIASVRELQLVPGKFVYTKSMRDGQFAIPIADPTPPLGFIFGYNSDAQQFTTFLNWFAPSTESAVLTAPTLSCCLDQGIVTLKKDDMFSVHPEPGLTQELLVFPLKDRSGNVLHPDSEAKDSFTHEKRVYPIKHDGDQAFAVDQAWDLLAFLLMLHELLNEKEINPRISFINSYFQGGLLAGTLRATAKKQ